MMEKQKFIPTLKHWTVHISGLKSDPIDVYMNLH